MWWGFLDTLLELLHSHRSILKLIFIHNSLLFGTIQRRMQSPDLLFFFFLLSLVHNTSMFGDLAVHFINYKIYQSHCGLPCHPPVARQMHRSWWNKADTYCHLRHQSPDKTREFQNFGRENLFIWAWYFGAGHIQSSSSPQMF